MYILTVSIGGAVYEDSEDIQARKQPGSSLTERIPVCRHRSAGQARARRRPAASKQAHLRTDHGRGRAVQGQNQTSAAERSEQTVAMIWMFDTDILIYFVNRKPGYERIGRRMSGRSPGELRLSAITLSEVKFGVENGQF